ncbi:putative ribose-phosphate pyrophosphokinase 2 [compost metagenome]
MTRDLPLLFALRDDQGYAARVARRLDCPLAAAEERDYEDGEHKCRPLESVDGRCVTVFAGLYGDAGRSVHDKLCRLLFFCGALKDAGTRHLQVVAPYLCYARKERRTQPQDPVISRYVATLLEACRVDRLLTLEVHNQSAFDNAFRIPTQHLECAGLFAEHFAGLLGDAEVAVVSPDTGGIKRAEQFRRALERRLGRPVGEAYMAKHRDNDLVSGSRLIGTVHGKTAILIDDLINTGSTLLLAGRACHDDGATRIYAGATHGLFTAGDELLASQLFERIVVCDSVPPFRLDPALVGQRLEVLDTSALVAAQLAGEYGCELRENAR